MRHLKLFEEYKEDELYQHIPLSSYVDLGEKRIKISQSVVDRILKIIHLKNPQVNDNIFSAGNFYTDRKGLLFYQLEDEYFLACIHQGGSQYAYVCDGLEGLEKLIVDENL